MSTIAMSGNDTIMLNNRVFADLADGNCVEITYPNDIMTVKTGKNGNTIYGVNETGRQCELKLRLIRDSSDDKFMLSLLSQQVANAAAFPLLIGSFIKKIGDGQGNVGNDTYILGGGVFDKNIPARTNVDGEAEQSVAEYSLRFSSSTRTIT